MEFGVHHHDHKAAKTEADVKKWLGKNGRCMKCGLKTGEVVRKGWFRRETRPLTIEGLVLAGRCLLCNPLQGNGVCSQSEEAPPSAQIAVDDSSAKDDASCLYKHNTQKCKNRQDVTIASARTSLTLCMKRPGAGRCTATMTCKPETTTIGDVKAELEKKTFLAKEGIRFLWGGREIPYEQTLYECGLRDELTFLYYDLRRHPDFEPIQDKCAPCPKGRMRIFVCNRCGYWLAMQVFPEATIEYVLATLKIPKEANLFYKGHQLKDNQKTLIKCGITPGSQLHIHEKVRLRVDQLEGKLLCFEVWSYQTVGEVKKLIQNETSIHPALQTLYSAWDATQVHRDESSLKMIGYSHCMVLVKRRKLAIQKHSDEAKEGEPLPVFVQNRVSGWTWEFGVFADDPVQRLLDMIMFRAGETGSLVHFCDELKSAATIASCKIHSGEDLWFVPRGFCLLIVRILPDRTTLRMVVAKTTTRDELKGEIQDKAGIGKTEMTLRFRSTFLLSCKVGGQLKKFDPVGDDRPLVDILYADTS